MLSYQQSLSSENNANKKALASASQNNNNNINNNSSLKLLEEFDKNFDDYIKVAQPAIKATLDSWKAEIEKTQERRRTRQIKIDVEQERKEGKLEQDELYCGVRLIDSNILREHAKNVQYLTKSPRNAILVAQEDANAEVSLVEKDFTLKGRYNGWELDFFQAIDGMETHGWDFIEIVFDPTKPGHFANEHIGHENLLFPTDTKDFKSAPFIIRTIDYTTKQLVTFAKKNGWNPEQVAKLLESNMKETQGSGDANCDRMFGLHQVQKVFYRNEDDGFIYVAWASARICDDWLREPRKLYLGKTQLNPNPTSEEDKYIQLFETSYSVEPLLYTISEDRVMMNIQGRVDLDETKQDAVTSLLTSFVTGVRRSAGLYFGTENNNGTPLDEAQTDIKLAQGRIFDANLKQFKIDAPSPELVNAINIIIGQSQMERGDVNYAVQSNKSTRKTSAEVKLAGSESELLSSIQVTLLSISLRNIFTRNFDIYQSRVKSGMIKVDPQVQQLLSAYNYIIKPAGDVDLIERQQKIMLMQQSWQVMQNTAAAPEFLKDLIKLLFPDSAQRYIEALGEDNAKNNIIEAAKSLIMEVMLDPNTGQLKPEFASYANELQQLGQAVAQITGATNPQVEGQQAPQLNPPQATE